MFVDARRLTQGRPKDQALNMTLLHATCVSMNGLGIVLRGPSGSGKSDLALRLIDGGATLISDDYCEIHVKDDTVIASTPKTIEGKIEARGIGIFTLPFDPSAVIGLVVDLIPMADIERAPDSLTCTLENISVPRIALDGGSASAPAKIKLVVDKLINTGMIVEE